MARITIEVSDEGGTLPDLHQRIISVAKDVLLHERVHLAEISVALVEGIMMRELNKRFLRHDYDTDVLSFALNDSNVASHHRHKEFVKEQGKRKAEEIHGEIIISVTKAMEVSKVCSWPVEEEVQLYLVHGLLHLLGYDDKTDQDRCVMRSREEVHLSRLGLKARSDLIE